MPIPPDSASKRPLPGAPNPGLGGIPSSPTTECLCLRCAKERPRDPADPDGNRPPPVGGLADPVAGDGAAGFGRRAEEAVCARRAFLRLGG